MQIFNAEVTGSMLVIGEVTLPILETTTGSIAPTEYLVVENNIVKKIVGDILGVLLIFIVLSGDVSSATARIVWATNKPATEEVLYGTGSEQLTLTTGVQDPAVDPLLKYHDLTLTKLGLETQYYFKVKSRTLTETSESLVYDFTTISTFNPIYLIPFSGSLVVTELSPVSHSFNASMNTSSLNTNIRYDEGINLSCSIDQMIGTNTFIPDIPIVDIDFVNQSWVYITPSGSIE